MFHGHTSELALALAPARFAVLVERVAKSEVIEDGSPTVGTAQTSRTRRHGPG